jgi:formylglycine-generating enzyme required for sulfatase activity
MLGFTFHDWAFFAIVVFIIALIVSTEVATTAKYQRVFGAAMLVASAGLCTLLLTTDTRDSVLFGFLADPVPEKDKKKNQTNVLVNSDEGKGKKKPGRDASGPGDGEGSAIDVTLGGSGSEGKGGTIRQGGSSGEGQSGGVGGGGGATVRVSLEDGQQGEAADILAEKAAQPDGSRYERDCPHCPDLIVIPAGSLRLGSSEEAGASGTPQTAVRLIRIARPFFIGRFEVTVNEFHAFVVATGYRSAISCVAGNKQRLGYDYAAPGFSQTGNHPVVCVTWNDAKAYSAWLSGTTGYSYRLPSENEWEYAARAMRRVAGEHFVYGREIMESEANFGARRSGTRPVGRYLPNKVGLFDVSGNAWELLEDCFEADLERLPADQAPHLFAGCTLRVMRGGAWYNGPAFMQLATRWANPQGSAGNGVGFRIARDLETRN